MGGSVEDLFRFVVTRPADKQTDTPPDSLQANTPVQQQLEQLAGQPQGAAPAVHQFAVQQLAALPVLANPLELPGANDLANLYRRLATLNDKNADTVRAAVNAILGNDLNAVVASGAFLQLKNALADGLIVLKVASRDPRRVAELVERLYRTSTLVQRIAQNAEAFNVPNAFEHHFTTPLRAPSFVALRKLSVPPPQAQPEPHSVRRFRDLTVAHDRLVRKREGLRQALDEILNVSASDLLQEAAADQPGERRPRQLPRRGVIQRGLRKLGVFRAIDETKPVFAAAPRAPGPRLSGAAVARLTPQTRAALQRLGVEPNGEAVTRVIVALRTSYEETQSRSRSLGSARMALAGPFVDYERSTALVGSAQRAVASSKFGGLVAPYLQWLDKGGKGGGGFAPLPGIPATHGSMQPAGIADLLVVKQHLKGYEGTDIAHVENVLEGETKGRHHRRTRRTEEFFLQEIETAQEEERDVQTTERFELQREASKTIKEDASLKTGVSVSGKYGPTTEFKAYADGAVSGAKEESKKQASTYAKEVTERSRMRVAERVRTERTRRVIDEFQEINTHQLQNPAGNGHIRGVYQWLDKIYEAQVWNYGIRTLYDFVIPEPGSLYIFAMQGSLTEATGLTPPKPFTITPAQLTPENYPQYIAVYGVSGVQPPPEPFVNKGIPISGATDDEDDPIPPKDQEIAITAGYEAYYASVIENSHVSFNTSRSEISVAIGERNHDFTFTNSSEWVTPLDGELESISVAVTTYRVKSFSLSIQLQFRCTARKFEEWQNATHESIRQAYVALQTAYEQQLAVAQGQQQNVVQGRNPSENRSIERAELKRGCISMLTAQHFDHFGAIQSGRLDFPQINLVEAGPEGSYIKFFEQAFEWEMMTYLFYPYFWARKTEWLDKIGISDSDPLFADFLRAGAARIVIPVREGFEAAVAHFMETGQVWAGGDVPSVNSDLFLDIISEIKSRQQAPLAEIKHGNPWEVRVPTSLVSLRANNDLPSWQEDQNGRWVPN
jgi:hypothetical protein